MARGGGKRAADRVAERLFEAGCRYAFGMPGGEILTVIDALARQASSSFSPSMRTARVSWPKESPV